METSGSLTLPIPPAHPCFASHFPGDPLVPGALLIEWIKAQLTPLLERHIINGIQTVKFLMPVRPNDKWELSYTIKWEKQLIAISLSRNEAPTLNTAPLNTAPLNTAPLNTVPLNTISALKGNLRIKECLRG
ncbi:hypothetical protein LU351_15585 [Marinibactrum halimedae]|uniref:ApeI dehydratase-like domain-containing protein n=1 Tax=Marinibactrum halimedae TaxID=1444977 RepID=A0AA37WPY3_9GAMM|nr:hypothetical protein [Marinibactrum halimedae]MCD9460428.1 hypothetical protein [Marinibactrum halimedae]GLS27441.1 hypothetical protein GCM10007877_31600 [Marinibactrum halimedae]